MGFQQAIYLKRASCSLNSGLSSFLFAKYIRVTVGVVQSIESRSNADDDRRVLVPPSSSDGSRDFLVLVYIDFFEVLIWIQLVNSWIMSMLSLNVKYEFEGATMYQFVAD